MEKKWGIFVVKRLHFSNFLDSVGLEKFLDCGWTRTEFLKIRTGSGLQNMIVRSSLARRSLLGNTKNQFLLLFTVVQHCRFAVWEGSPRGTVPCRGMAFGNHCYKVFKQTAKNSSRNFQADSFLATKPQTLTKLLWKDSFDGWRDLTG